MSGLSPRVRGKLISSGWLTADHNGTTWLLAFYSATQRAKGVAFVRMAYQALCSHERTLIGTFEREAGQPETQPSAESDTEKSVLWLLFVFLPLNKLSSLPVFGQALIADAVAALLWPLQAGHFLLDEVLASEGRFAGMLLGAVGLILLVLLADWVSASLGV